jgi:protein-disulfide isomerase
MLAHRASCRHRAEFWSKPLTHLRRRTALSLAGLIALAAHVSLLATTRAAAQNAGALAAEPVSLPDMSLGSPNAPVTIIEYSSMTCSHCAVFEQNTFPMIKSRYIDTGQVRFVFREYPIDDNAFGASMMARCIANDDPGRYFGAVDSFFRQEDQLVHNAMNTLRWVGSQSGLSDSEINNCLNDQDLYQKLAADRKIAMDMVKVDAAPTFFVNGRKYTGNMPADQMDGIIRSALRR